MELTEISKLVAALISILGTFTITFYNANQSKKIRVELLREFDDAVKEKSKHRVCEIFRLIYGLRMNYSDILKLIENDEVVKLTYALNKTPGMVTFKDGDFQYNGVFKKKWWHKIDRTINRISTLYFGLLLSLCGIGIIFSRGISFIILFICAICFSVVFAISWKENRYDAMVDSLVKNDCSDK